MTDRPILFSAPMVKALLAGTKTQTRRTAGVPAIEETPSGVWHVHNRHGGEFFPTYSHAAQSAWGYLPIEPGDRLWVKENGWERPERTEQMMRDGADTWEPYYFDADLDEQDHRDLKSWGFKRRPSIHMRRVFSRITLHVTDARVQRLQDISEADAKAEGAQFHEPKNHLSHGGWSHDEWYVSETAKGSYQGLWDRINGEGSWAKNPFVAAYTFTVERCNIEQARASA